MLGVLGCSSPTLTPVDGGVHAGSGVVFPEMVDDFVCVGITQQGEDAYGVQYKVHFSGQEVDILAAVVANDAHSPELLKAARDAASTTAALGEYFEAARLEIEGEGDDVEFRYIASYDISTVKGKTPYFGKKAFFRTAFGAFLNLYVFEYGEWFVVYKAEFPRDLDIITERFVENHAWGG